MTVFLIVFSLVIGFLQRGNGQEKGRKQYESSLQLENREVFRHPAHTIA
jgi:hypothetical protein